MTSPCPCRGCKAAYAAALSDAATAVMRVDDRWSIVTQNADTRELMQWCFREYRKAIEELKP